MNELRVIENELIPVYETSTGEKVVYGTELYSVLGVKSKFADWVKTVWMTAKPRKIRIMILFLKF